MEETARCRRIMEEDIGNGLSISSVEAVLFIDEAMYRYFYTGQPICRCQKEFRNILSGSGVAYDTLLITDMAECIRYKAVVLPVPFDTPLTIQLKALCRKHRIPVLQPNADDWKLTPDRLRTFFKAAGVWCCCETNDVLYIGRGYLAIHASEAERKEIILPGMHTILPIDGGRESPYVGKTLLLETERHETRLFRLEPEENHCVICQKKHCNVLKSLL